MNTFGTHLRLTTFGESHGPAVGGVLDGLPPRLRIDMDDVAREIAARRPGARGTSQRRESDSPEFLSGLTRDNLTLGSPIAFIVRNTDARPADYDALADRYRPNHADYTTIARYGIRDPRGGGRASARETVARVIAGALTMQWLATGGIRIAAALTGAGSVMAENLHRRMALSDNPAQLLDIPSALREEMMAEIERARLDGDSVGGRVTCVIEGLPAGIGSPVYSRLHARLAEAMMGINAAHAFEYGLGMELASASGVQTADRMRAGCDRNPLFTSNYSGGIQGGISNGMPVYFSVVFKPTPSVATPLESVDALGHDCIVSTTGRHDPCVALRAAPVVKAMAALTVGDSLLENPALCAKLLP